jgi:hypothetical protein
VNLDSDSDSTSASDSYENEMEIVKNPSIVKEVEDMVVA